MTMVTTVLGPVAAAELGVVLPHEHVFFDLRPRFTAPAGVPATLTDEPVQLANLSWVRYHQRNNRDNLVLDDVTLLASELASFRDAGGGTVVDLSPQCAGRDVAKLVKVAEATGLNVITGTGFYVDEFQSPETRAKSVDELAAVMVAELTTGIAGPDCEGTGVRAGIIGEIGCSWPLTDSERRVLQASALAQQQTGAAISVHPGRDGAAPHQIAAILRAAGADLSRVVMGHIDRTFDAAEDIARLGDLGVFLEFDLFGQESSHIRYGSVDLPTDLGRLRVIECLVRAGYGQQILVSHDIALKHHLSAYGGHGYAHLLDRVRPRMPEAGLSDAEIDQILQASPASLLAMPG
jgi:phosphotriesterase-related protein